MRQKPLPRPRRPRKAKAEAEPWPPRELLLPSLDKLRRLSEPSEVLLPVGGHLVPVPTIAPAEQAKLFDNGGEHK